MLAIFLLFTTQGRSQSLDIAKKFVDNYDFINAKQEILKITGDSLSGLKAANYYELYGDISEKLNQSAEACVMYNKANNIFEKLGKAKEMQEVRLKLAIRLNESKSTQDYSQRYLNQYEAYALDQNDSTMLAKLYKTKGTLMISKDVPQSVEILKKALLFESPRNRGRNSALVYNNLSVVHTVLLNKPDIGLQYLAKALPISLAENDFESISLNYMNRAAAYTAKHDFKSALKYLELANRQPLRSFVKKTKFLIYGNFAKVYDSLHDFKNAREAQKTQQKYGDSLNEEAQELSMLESQAKYRFKENELIKANQQTTIKNKSLMNNIFIGLLLIVAIFGVFIFRSIKKTKQIAHQQLIIETQKHEKELKDQELHSIDLMLETQEKERQNIANELHDNLGSMLATLKMNFENLKIRQQEGDKDLEPLYVKTDQLLDDAYQNVRTIAHLKNLGVAGAEGLLIAVQRMAEKMSVLERLIIEVFPFGLEQRLDNQLEVTLFRIIQELCANVIKHSKASQVGIYLTQHENHMLNIMIEDNGIGFSTTKRKSNDGIGLNSIEKKVEQLGGTFTVDSTIGNGTTIIIEIPT